MFDTTRYLHSSCKTAERQFLFFSVFVTVVVVGRRCSIQKRGEQVSGETAKTSPLNTFKTQNKHCIAPYTPRPFGFGNDLRLLFVKSTLLGRCGANQIQQQAKNEKTNNSTRNVTTSNRKLFRQNEFNADSTISIEHSMHS